MTPAEIREAILDILSDIAPDEDLSDLKDDVPFREQAGTGQHGLPRHRDGAAQAVPRADSRGGLPAAGQHEQHGQLPGTADEGHATASC